MEQYDIFAVLGPTASGKTAYAIDMARRMGGAVISADSRQVYAGMNIGTAKPESAWSTAVHAADTPDTIEGIDHYLLNIASPDTSYTLSDYIRDATHAIAIIRSRGLVPIIAGGTMLYIDAIIDGYAIPNVAPNDALRRTLESLPADDLYKMLLAQDPDAREFIEPHNRRRIIRALEVMESTGKKFSDLRSKRPSPMNACMIGLFPDWESLRKRIAKRAEEMVESGLEDEIATLKQHHPQSKLLHTMNYKEHCDTEKMVQSNMRYAHRQMSWWKRRDDIGWVCAPKLKVQS